MRYPSFFIGFILCLQYEKHWHLTGRSLRSDSRSSYADSALIQGSELSVMMSDSRGLGREDTAPATSLILIRCNLEKCTYSWLYDPSNSLNINMSKKPQTFHWPARMLRQGTKGAQGYPYALTLVTCDLSLTEFVASVKKIIIGTDMFFILCKEQITKLKLTELCGQSFGVMPSWTSNMLSPATYIRHYVLTDEFVVRRKNTSSRPQTFHFGGPVEVQRHRGSPAPMRLDGFPCARHQHDVCGRFQSHRQMWWHVALT